MTTHSHAQMQRVAKHAHRSGGGGGVLLWHKWWAVMVAATLGPRDSTKEAPAAEVICCDAGSPHRAEGESLFVLGSRTVNVSTDEQL